MIRKRFYTVVISLLATSYVCAQANILNATKVEEIGKQTDARIAADNDGPLAYGYIDERDILWSKVVWEFVDLNQKINLPYYFPIDTSNISNDRRSLFDTLLRGIRKGSIKIIGHCLLLLQIFHQLLRMFQKVLMKDGNRQSMWVFFLLRQTLL